MIHIHTLLVGQPQTITDERGTWRSAIFRSPVTGTVELTQRGLAGDQVGDTANHGSPDQAVCCHPLEHYDAWNAEYDLATPPTMLGPGSVGENWTLADAGESSLHVGDIFAVGDARVQISGPRFPCTKQERKLKLPGFHRRTIETLRTGFYLRVLTPGTVQAGDSLTLEARPCPDVSLLAVNRCVHQAFDPAFARRLLATPELATGWKRILSTKLTG
jgi:MOSC domain-containing protein YiiM